MLKLPEVAQRLGVSEKTARRYIKAGTIPSVFIGNAYRVQEDDLEEYVRQAQVEPGGTSAPKVLSRPSPEAPNSGDEGRRSLYLTTLFEQARDMAEYGLWMRDMANYGESPQELTGWSWKISDFQSQVWVMQERWETRVFGPLSEQSVPSWERYLLDQVREDLEKAENAAYQADRRFLQHLDNQDARIKKTVEQLLESARVPPRYESSSDA